MDYKNPSVKSKMVCLLLISTAFFLFGPTYFTQEKSLIQRDGIVEDVRVFYEQVSFKGSISIRSVLVFNFKSEDIKYIIFKNIGNDASNPRYEKMRRDLERSKRAKVWIKKSEIRKMQPEVFQIAGSSGVIVYSFEDAKQKDKFGFWTCILFSVFIIIFDLLQKNIITNPDSKCFLVFTKLKLFILRVIGPLLAIFFGLLFYSFLKSDSDLNLLTIFFGLLSIGFTCGSLLFEISLKKQIDCKSR